MNLLRRICGKGARTFLRPVLQRVGCGHLSSVALEHVDLQLIDIIQASRGGYFVEAGANDGILQSNTYYLEKVLNWHGLLIEPLPHKAKACAKNRSRSDVVNAALVSHDFLGEAVEIEPADLMSVVRDGTVDEAWLDEHVRLGRQVQNLRPESRVRVPAKPLSSILRERGIKRVNFFSLDVEGYEVEVLKGIDFDACRFDWIFVETRPQIEAAVDQLLASAGMVWRRSWTNESYANKLYQFLEA